MTSPDDMNELLARLRATPTPADPDRVSPGFETRVLARMRRERNGDGLTWFWRWSAVFGTTAIVCGVFAVQSYNALLDESLTALDGGSSLLTWFF